MKSFTQRLALIVAMATLLVSISTVMVEAITVSGQVTSDCDPMGMENVYVMIFHFNTGEQFLACTDALGDYSFTVPAGQMMLQFDVPSGYQAPRPFVFLDLTSDDVENFALTCVNPTISGRVISDCEPTGVPGVTVNLTLSDGTILQDNTDGAGSFSFANVSDQTVSSQCDPAVQTPILSVIPPTDYEFVYPPSGQVTVALTGDRNFMFRLQCPRTPTHIYFEDFEEDGHGWSPRDLTPGISTASFRLTSDYDCVPGGSCMDNGRSWVAFDPTTGVVPLAPDMRICVQSSPIPLPNDAVAYELSFCWYRNNFDFENQHFMTFSIISIDANGVETPRSHPYLYYSGNPGWNSFTSDISTMIIAGAAAIKIELIYVDNPTFWPDPPGCCTPTEAPYFDNVLLTAFNTNETPVTLPPGISCPIEVEGTVVTVSGTVTSDCQGHVPGVEVALELPSGEWMTTTTDEGGEYLFSEVASSPAEGQVSIAVPLGFQPDTPTDGHEEITFAEDQVVDFTLSCVDARRPAKGLGYWKHQAKTYMTGNGKPHESQDDMETNYPTLIFDHFHENQLASIAVPNVTFIEDGNGNPVPITLDVIFDTLHPGAGPTALDRAKQHYLVVLLNVASGRLRTYDNASADGRTVSQGLQEIADLILDGDPVNDGTAVQIGVQMNNGGTVSAGLIRDHWENIPYRDPDLQIGARQFKTALMSVSPSPFKIGATVRFQLGEEQPIAVRVYSVSGKLVRELVNEKRSAGRHAAVWDGRDDGGRAVSSGIYYVRLETKGYDATKRVVVVK